MAGAYIPRTDLGRLLAFLRKKALERGIKELSEEEILEELRKRRCGDDADSCEDT